MENPRVPREFLERVKILIVGGGSIGKRHLGNLLGLGASNVAVVEPREDRRAELRERFGEVVLYASEDEAYANGKFDGVIIANPTAFHIDSGNKAVAHGAHILMEKAISDRLEGVADFLRAADAAKRFVFVGYTYRFSDSLKKIEELLKAGAIGKIFAAEITFSEWLPGWHPWEKPGAWYMGNKNLGGGELLDENHTIDFARWLFGEVKEVMAFVGRVGEVTVDTDDLSKLICLHQNGIVSSIHLDALGRRPRKEMWVTGEKGSIFWDSYMSANRIDVYYAEPKRTETYPSEMNRNDMFVEEIWHFLELLCRGGKPVIDGADALKTLEASFAAMESWRDGKRVSLKAD